MLEHKGYIGQVEFDDNESVNAWVAEKLESAVNNARKSGKSLN